MSTLLKRVLTILVAVLILGYVAYQVVAFLHTSATYETVMTDTVYEVLDVQGIAIRNEQVLTEADGGYLYYTLKNGDRVANGGTIADVYPSEQDAILHEQITHIDEEITALQTLQKQGTASKINLDAVNAQIRTQQRALAQAVISGDMTVTNEAHRTLTDLINRKQIAIGKAGDFSARLAALAAERSALYAQYHAAVRTVESPQAGYFISKVDGYETILPYGKAATLSTDAIRTMIDTKPTVADTYIGKVVGDYEWYLACIVPTEKLAFISVGGSLEIRLPFVSGDTIPVTVESVNKTGNEAAVILRCDYMSEELSAARTEQVQLLLKEYTGLYVPNEAIHFNDQKESGVYVRMGNTLMFRKVEVLYFSENGKYAICADNGEDGYLKLYDDMVIEGKNLYDGKMVR